MLTKTSLRPLRKGLLTAGGLALLWVVVAIAQQGTTYHLAPLLVAGALPIVVTLNGEDQISAQQLVLPTLIGLVGALAATLLLAVLDRMQGPSLLPIGGAATESVVFALVGAIGGALIALSLRPR